jgi:hypothetical protein
MRIMATKALVKEKTDLGPAGLRSFFRIAGQWKLNTNEQIGLLNVPPSTFHGWKANPDSARLTHDTLERISYVLGIYKDLHMLFSNKNTANSWVHQQNKAPLCGGAPAIARMTSGNVSDLFLMRRYLDAQVRG